MEKLNNIVEDAKAALVEYAIKAAVTGYADGIKLGYDAAKTDELCDSFIGVWNDRAAIIEDKADGELDAFIDGMQRGRLAKVADRYRDEWCDGFIEGWNANAHKVKVCHVVADEDACLWTCSVCGNDLYDMDRYCSKCGAKIVEHEPKKAEVYCQICRYCSTDWSELEQGDFCDLTGDNIVDHYNVCGKGERR